MNKPKPVNAIEKILADSEKMIKIIDTHYDIIYMEIVGIKNRLTRLEKEKMKRKETKIIAGET